MSAPRSYIDYLADIVSAIVWQTIIVDLPGARRGAADALDQERASQTP